MYFSHISFIFVVSLALFSVSYVVSLPKYHLKKKVVAIPTISVNANGSGKFKTIQAAIDSVPSNNNRWICIHIAPGTYREQISIPLDKPFIYLKGDNRRKTVVVWNGHDSIATSATFTSSADNIIAKGITFVNSYNVGSGSSGNRMQTAVAARIEGDKSAFYRCAFVGLQDTLWDVQGRHYFRECSIQGAVDFIFGAGQSLYEGCTISVVALQTGASGYITAQARSHPNDGNGFVFKDCKITGKGKAYLGRPWRDYARVIFFNTIMDDVIVPQGWDAWSYHGRENQLTFVEHNCRGLGSNPAQRVGWANKMSREMLQQLEGISFIDNEGWMRRLVINIVGRKPRNHLSFRQ